MSSIISDIFYNSTNNALIDNYLLNRNANDSEISYKNDSNNLLGNKINELKIRSKNNYYRGATDYGYEQVVKQVSLKFKILIHPQKSDKNNKLGGIFKSNAIYLLKVKIGLNFIEEHIQPNSNYFSTSQLQLQLPIQQIYSHPAISIELYQSNKSNKPMGTCFLPLENVRGMINKKQEKGNFDLIMKQNQINKYKENIKYKVQCQLKIENNIGEYSNSQSVLIKNKEKKIKMIEHGSLKNTQRSAKQSNSYGNSRGHSVKKSSHQNLFTVTQNPRKNRTGTNKQSYKFDQHQYDEIYEMKEKKQKYAFSSFSRSQSNITGNQTENIILKFQLDNKPARFKINEFKNKSEDKSHINYRFCIKEKSKAQNNVELYNFNQQIIIASAQIDKNGINIEVLSIPQNQTQSTSNTCIGYFHLNIVLLLSGIVEGIFPVLSHHNTQCIGFAKLQSLQLTKVKNQLHYQIDTSERQRTEVIQKQERIESQMIQGYVVEIVKIYSTGQQIDKYFEQGLENKTGQIIIRLSDSSIKVCKQCQLTKLTTNNKATKQQNENLILCITIKDPIIITYQDHPLNKKQSLEIQVYIDYQLIAYHKAVIQLNQITNQNSITYGTIVQNFTTGPCISNAIVNYARFSLFPDYFPQFRFEDSVRYLLNWEINSFILEILSKKDYNQIEKQVVQKILSLDSKIIYIQAIRLATLLIKSIMTDNFYYTLVHQISQSTFCTWNKQKFIEQIKYLDFSLNGFVNFQDFQSILNYYKVDKKICKGWIRRCCGSNTQQFYDQTDEVLYLGLLVYHQCETILHKVEIQNRMIFSKKIEYSSNVEEIESKQIKVKQKESVPQKMPQYSNKQVQKVHIQAISCQKMHKLMLNNSIPSLRIKIINHEQQYMSRPVYSCANPIIKLNKKINQNSIIIFLHYNLKMGKDIEIGRINLIKGQKLYQLGNQARVQLLEIQ